MTGETPTGQPVTYDRALFHHHLSDIRTYLGELRYIDRAHAYLEEHQASWWHYSPIGQGVVTLDVKLGTTVPFTRRYQVPDHVLARFPWQDSKREEIHQHLRNLEQEARAWATANVVDLTDRITPYLHPSPALYEYGVIDPLVGMHQTLEDEVSDDFGKLRHSFSDWEGEAADNFATYFYHPFARTLAAHKRLLSSLSAAVVAAKVIAESTRHSFMTVVSGVREQLLEQLKRRAAHAALDREQAERTILVMASGAISVVSTLFSQGLWAATMATATADLSIAATTVPEDTTVPHSLGGVTAEEVLDSFIESVVKIGKYFYDQQEELEREVKGVLSRVELLRDGPLEDDGRLVPVTPDIVDGVDADNFYLP